MQRVGTWHTDDYAIQLLSDDARIWQDNGTATSESSRCFEFGMVAQIDRDTRVFLELDFLADGSVEFSQRLPPSRWERLTFRITAPTWYRGVRFSLRKDGPGRAILAELSALNAPGTCTAPPIELHDRPARATCSTDEDCADGRCENGRCADCSDDADCSDADRICGLTLVGLSQHHTCVRTESGAFGTICERDAQCQSGHCDDHACSECSGDSCEDGRTCSPAWRSDRDTSHWPKLCAPGSRTRASGELCTSNSDCESGRCALTSCRDESCETVLAVGACL